MVVNKIFPEDMLDTAASTLMELSHSSAEDSHKRVKAIQVVIALGRALLWRSYEVDPILSRLKELLEDPDYGGEAARGFELLLASDEIVCEENGANIQPFIRQRIFGTCLPDIAAKIRSANATKVHYLLALAGLLKHIDISMLYGETETILPPLLQILDLPIADARAAAINLLAAMLQEDPTGLEEHASSLLSRLLAVAADAKTNDAVSLPPLLSP